jgi:hypothetical protein
LVLLPFPLPRSLPSSPGPRFFLFPHVVSPPSSLVSLLSPLPFPLSSLPSSRPLNFFFQGNERCRKFLQDWVILSRD